MIGILKKRFAYFCIFLCGLSAILTKTLAKPSLTFTLPPSLTSLPTSFASLTQEYVDRKHAEQMKTYSGHRLRNDSLLMVYHYDQTVAIVELGPGKLLLGCELIEIYNDNEGKKLLKQLSEINKPMVIKFKEMLNLMRQCDIVEGQNRKKIASRTNESEEDTSEKTFAQRQFPNNPLSLLSGIIPGTKWCGTGDIAKTYSDLGPELQMDVCCRAHDLCPMKVRAYENRYNMTNNSIYTKSHCICDDMLYDCLKKMEDVSAAQLMGSIYFNIIQVPCIHNTKTGIQYRKAREGF